MKTLKLVKAEFIKIFARKSTWVIVILAALLVAFSFASNKIFSSVEDYDYYSDMAKWEIESLDNILSDYKDKTDNKSMLLVKMIEYKKSLLNEIKDMDIIHNEWKNELNSEYQTVKSNLLFLSLLKEGYNLSDIRKANELMYDSYVIEEEVAINYETKTEKELETYEKELKTKANELHEMLIGNKTYKDYLLREINGHKSEIASNSKLIQENKQEIIKINNKQQREALENSNKDLELSNERLNYIIYWKQYMVDKKINEENWKHSVIMNIIDYYSYSFKNDNTYTEEEYYKSDEYAEYRNKKLNVDYEDYLKIKDEEKQKVQNSFIKNVYAVENNININNGSKTILKNSSLVYQVIGVVSIIIAGTIVAKEFSTGSIRMLLIRPVKRWKILLAKLITTLIFMVILTIILFIVSFITTGICYGFSDFMTNDLNVINGKIAEVSFFIQMLKIYSISLIPVLFFVIFAFAVSTVLRSSAAAIALPLAGMLGGQIVQMLFYMNPKVWLSYTPIPYISLSPLLEGGSYADMISSMNIMYNMNISVLNGSLIYVILTVIILFITFVVFNKIDIKNQ